MTPGVIVIAPCRNITLFQSAHTCALPAGPARDGFHDRRLRPGGIGQ
jgi:hypothetical protein